MAKKKVKKVAKKKTTKKVSKKNPVKKVATKKVNSSKPAIKSIRATPSRIRLVLKNLILFVILSIISYVLYAVSNNEVFSQFFAILTMVLSFISLAFLISLLVFLVLKSMRK